MGCKNRGKGDARHYTLLTDAGIWVAVLCRSGYAELIRRGQDLAAQPGVTVQPIIAVTAPSPVKE